jgi:hypothetical protein
VSRRVLALALSPLALASLLVLPGCGEDPEVAPLTPVPGAGVAAPEGDAATTLPPGLDQPPGAAQGDGAPLADVDPDSLIRAVVSLIRSAPSNPGGDNFTIAKDHLNHFFAGASRADFALPEATRAYLRGQFGPGADQAIQNLEAPTFTIQDSRHIEDCLLLQQLARRVAGDGDDLVRVRRLFDWVVRQVQLVPAGSLAPPGLTQAAARPYDVLLRGMATEQGEWAERSWLFIALCRQIGVDAGLIVYEPAAPAVPAPPADGAAPPASRPIAWIATALVGGRPYLFDCGLGLPIPGPGGRGVATLEEAIADPEVLDGLDLPGRPYPTHRAELAGAKLRVLVDSTVGTMSPRMRQLQLNLAGPDRMVLFRDPADADAAFAKALGGRLVGTALWKLPIDVSTLLFTDPNFVTATQHAIRFFDAALPLLPARMSQIRGELNQAVESYAGFRFAESPVLNDGKTPIPKVFQDVLDQYATYYLALAKLDQARPDQAAFFFRESLRLLPPVSPQNFYVSMFRWGAETNLGLLSEGKGDAVEAVRHYTAPQPTTQQHGNLLRARALIWNDPFVPDAPAVPPAVPPAPTASAAR